MTENVLGTPGEVRKFGLLFFLLFGLAAIYFSFAGKGWWVYAAGAAILFLVLGLWGQPLLRPVYIAWMKFAFVLGWINTRVLLAIFFFIVMTPVGGLARLFGKDFLDARIDREAKSYWVSRNRKSLPREQYERLF